MITIGLMWRAFVYFVCCGLMAQGQQPVDPSTLARVDGQVVNSVTGEPLRKAEMTLHGTGGEYSATSDASGHFAIERVKPGTYSLTGQHQNFALQDYGATRPGNPGTRLTLSAGQSAAALEMKLTPFGVISGKVVDQDGDPVAGVPVTVMKWGYARGARQLMPAGGGSSSNDRGEYRVYNLAAGRYFLMARPIHADQYAMSGEVLNTAGTTAGTPRETFAPTFYPSSPDVTAAAAIPVSAGQEAQGIDIQLRKARGYTIQGRVTGVPQGHRISFSLQPADSSSLGFGMGRSGMARPDGSFTVRGVTPGAYNLMVMLDNRMGARQDIVMGDGDLEGLAIVVTEPGTVKGKVRVEAAGTATTPSVKGLRVSLMPVVAIPMNIPNANTADDGSFTLEQVPADRYKVTCSPLDGTYLKAIRWNGQVSNDGVVEMGGSGTANLELVFTATSAQIEGDVKTADDQPAPGVRVLLVPASRREADFRVITADQSGHFSAKGVAPGSYSALATDADIFGMPDAGLTKALEKEMSPVTVDENGHATVALKLVPSATIEAAQ